MDSNWVLYISKDEIAQTVRILAQAIDQDYEGRSLVVVAVLKGAFIFVADLIRELQTPVNRIELLRLASYGAGTTSSGEVRVLLDLPPETVIGQHVLLVEDIVDSGRSTTVALNLLKEQNPASIKLCSLLSKPDRRVVPVKIDYCGLTIEDKFVIGYGLDWDERYRDLPDIYVVEGNEK
ncbi:MAG: hypoxanthine phosphoribosyltransferase [Cyanobacteria bacterium P01_H01_bin.153]